MLVVEGGSGIRRRMRELLLVHAGRDVVLSSGSSLGVRRHGQLEPL